MRRRPVLPALAAVMLLVVGQLVALAHEAAERHVTCDEHGEELEAVELANAVHACEHDHWIAVDDLSGGHDACTMAHALRPVTASACPPHLPPLAVVTVASAARSVAAHVQRGALYRIAPKTSPPV